MFYATVAPTAGCCGVTQICYMLLNAMGPGPVAHVSGEEFSGETWVSVLSQISESEPSGQVFQIWFVNNVDFNGEKREQYQVHALRELVRNLPDVVSLGEFVNPNSSNYIDGYQWVNP